MFIGLGMDLIECERVARAIERHPDAFLQRCFTAQEQAYCNAGGAARLQRYAARFAAKEAVAKALGTGFVGGMALTDVEVVKDASGCPGVQLHAEAAARAAKLGVVAWKLSLTHLKQVAGATAIALGGPCTDTL